MTETRVTRPVHTPAGGRSRVPGKHTTKLILTEPPLTQNALEQLPIDDAPHARSKQWQNNPDTMPTGPVPAAGWDQQEAVFYTRDPKERD